MNIPVCRAKKINSNEYIEGYIFWGKYILLDQLEDVCPVLNHDRRFDFGSGNIAGDYFEIDTTTLSINLPDMIDSQGNKIFASLSEDGKGGDICATQSGINHLLVFKEFAVAGKNTDFFGRFTITNHNGINKNFVENTNYKVIGIQE